MEFIEKILIIIIVLCLVGLLGCAISLIWFFSIFTIKITITVFLILCVSLATLDFLN
jgi:hypothetical protein